MGRGRSGGIGREDAEQLVIFLCWRVGVPVPSRIDWLARAHRGQYADPVPRKAPRGVITVGPKVRDGLAAVVHETAHHVLAMRRPRMTVAEYRRQLQAPGKMVHHGPVFVETLRELAGVWYGDAALYPWETEYPSVRAAGAAVRS